MTRHFILTLLTAILLFSCQTSDVKTIEPTPPNSDSISYSETSASIDSSEAEEYIASCSKFEVVPDSDTQLDPSIIDFNAKLKEAVSNKDIHDLLKLVDSGIVTSHGGGIAGIKDFVLHWKLDSNPQTSDLWANLNRVLELGGCFNPDEDSLSFIYPYLQSSHYFKTCNFDWFSTCICTKQNVYIYNKPDLKSNILDTLDYRVLNCGMEQKIIDKFLAVKTTDNKIEGYVLLDNVYFTADYLLHIEKKKGVWKITAFAAYD